MSWFKIHREDRDRILETCGARRLAALALWAALSDLANKHEGFEFTASRMQLASLSGLCERSVAQILIVLRDAGLLAWEQAKTDGGIPMAPSRYSMKPTVGTQFPPRKNSVPTPRELDSQGGRHDRRHSIPSAIIGKIKEGGETPRGLSTSERIGLEKEQKRLEEKLSDLRAEWQCDKSEKLRSEIGSAKERLANIAERLGGSYGQ